MSLYSFNKLQTRFRSTTKIPENPLNNLQCYLQVLAMHRLTKLISYEKSGQEQMMTYIKEPTKLQYGTRDIYSTS
jgi:hypothetical protein